MIPDVLPQSALPVQPHDEPHLEGAEAAAKGDVPVAVVGDGTLEEKTDSCFFKNKFYSFPTLKFWDVYFFKKKIKTSNGNFLWEIPIYITWNLCFR